MQESGTRYSRQRAAAVCVLGSHYALTLASESEPACDAEGMPLDSEAWLVWDESTRGPAYAAWSAAMDELDAAIGHKVSRHSYNFRPLCESILDG